MAEIFQRFEKKYLLDREQYRKIIELIEGHMIPDKFFRTRVNSIYYDTDDDRLIRRSIEKPEYKEKLRIRAYGDVKPDDMIYVELKKKYDGIVYKRRTKARYQDLLEDIYGCSFEDRQIGEEIRYALKYYERLKPAWFISCMRTSYVDKDDRRLRITFDDDMVYRNTCLSLKNTPEDRTITDKIVMELKVPGPMPLWLTEILDEVKAYPRGFSKVGTAYMKEMEGKTYE